LPEPTLVTKKLIGPVEDCMPAQATSARAAAPAMEIQVMRVFIYSSLWKKSFDGVLRR
jgi:hypothetical protein